MKPRIHRRSLRLLPLLALPVWVACAPEQNESEEEIVDAYNAEQFRTEVTSALNEIQAELSALQERVEPAVEESWNELTSSTQSASSEIMSELDRLATATADEARAIQQAAAERLAELEAEVVRAEISSVAERDSLVTVANDHLSNLEEDIASLASLEPDMTGETMPSTTIPVEIDEQAALQERLGNVRTSVAEAAGGTEEDFEEIRENISTDIAQLTEEVRRRWYEGQWGVQG